MGIVRERETLCFFFPSLLYPVRGSTHLTSRMRQNFRKLSPEKKWHVHIALMAVTGGKCSFFCETFPQDSRYESDKSGTSVFNTHRKDESRGNVTVACTRNVAGAFAI